MGRHRVGLGSGEIQPSATRRSQGGRHFGRWVALARCGFLGAPICTRLRGRTAEGNSAIPGGDRLIAVHTLFCAGGIDGLGTVADV